MSSHVKQSGDEAVLVNPRTGRIHKRRVLDLTMCGTDSPNLTEEDHGDIVAEDETEHCVICFDEQRRRRYDTCAAITGTDDSRFRKKPFGTFKGFNRARPCEICFRTESGDVRTPDDDEQVLAIDSRKRTCVHTVPNNWGGDE